MSDNDTVNHDKTALKTMHDIVDVLLEDDVKSIRGTLASLSYLTVAQEAILAKDEDVYVRAFLAGNKHNDPQTYIDLFFNEAKPDAPIHNVYEQLAENPNCPETVLRELMAHKDNKKIISLLVENPSTPNDLIFELSKNEDFRIRQAALSVMINRVDKMVKKNSQ